MLDINYIRTNPDKVKQACEHKQFDSSVVDTLLQADEQRRSLKKQVDEIRRQVNVNADKIKTQVHAGGQPDEDLIEHGKQLKAKLKQVGPKFKQAVAIFESLMLSIPNIPADDVPAGEDETGNKVVRQFGELPTFEFEPLAHQEIMEKLDWVDTARAVRISGFRSYFLKNQGMLLEQAILRYALDFMVKQGFTPMTVPVLVNESVMVGTGFFPWGEEDHYRTQDGQLLAGTAEVALTSYHMGETLIEENLPIKLAGISPCFRREVGSHGKDTRGIIRVHQFTKVEQMVLTVADEEVTRKWHETMVGFVEEMLVELRLPYQVLLMCTGDMGAGQRKKYDVEVWFPSQNKYRETHSASYFNDFQTRRLGIKYQAKDGTLKYAYSLNNTVAASPRLLAAIVENFQQADGSVKIPKVLQKFM